MNKNAIFKPRLKNPYPAIDFQRAYGYLLKIKDKFPSKDLFERKELLEKALGFAETNGAGHNVVGALAHYNLVWRQADKNQTYYKITDQARRLLAFRANYSKWAPLALELAMSPVLFEFLYSKYPDGKLPLGVDSALIRKYPEVTSKNVSAIIYRFKASLKFVQTEESSDVALQLDYIKADLKDESDEKQHEIDMGDGILISISENKLRKILKEYLNNNE